MSYSAGNDTYERTFADRQTAINIIHSLAEIYRNAPKTIQVILRDSTVVVPKNSSGALEKIAHEMARKKNSRKSERTILN